jgi:hypothetical protein
LENDEAPRRDGEPIVVRYNKSTIPTADDYIPDEDKL